jgi:hypothetical protein
MEALQETVRKAQRGKFTKKCIMSSPFGRQGSKQRVARGRRQAQKHFLYHRHILPSMPVLCLSNVSSKSTQMQRAYLFDVTGGNPLPFLGGGGRECDVKERLTFAV